MSKIYQAYKEVRYRPGLERIKTMCRKVMLDRVSDVDKQALLKKQKERQKAAASTVAREIQRLS
ncbi:hypothetical protein [Paenibacillus oryzisoli]|uniref:hypothetical protein n=1 Tax=Paenibacillus oryzisoli TaxID=1850517 RepID=UPI0012FAD8E6|nr:hypothetical protein [Paenibacillus oryzisoli]